MSKQSEAKEKQNYCEKPLAKICGYCKHLMQRYYHYSANGDRVEGKYIGINNGPTFSDNLRCGIGGFAVNKTATCDSMEELKKGE